MTTRQDRIMGVLTGQAAGDALGAGYEFGPPGTRHAHMKGGGIAGWQPGQWTDDTEQAIIVARAKCDVLDVAEGLLAWFRAGPADVGVSTGRLLSQVHHAGDLPLISREHGAAMAARPVPRGWDPGMANGSLMRTGPVALPFLGDEPRIAERARVISDLTHFDMWAGDACVIWSVAIGRAVLQGALDLPKALRDIIDAWIPQDRREFWLGVCEQALSDTPPGPRNGSAVRAFRAALWAVAHGQDFKDVCELAVFQGGDTDTVGAIAGALAGALYGASAVPAEWRDMLHGWPGLRAGELEALAWDAAGQQPSAGVQLSEYLTCRHQPGSVHTPCRGRAAFRAW